VKARVAGSRLVFLVVTIAITIVAVGEVGALAFTAVSSGGSSACPDRPRTARPVAFHFTPGLEQHASWVEFAVPEPDATGFMLCLDGQLFETGIGETPLNGRVAVSVPTRWVDAQWLRGQLGAAMQPDRWELRYTTYTTENG
jgi:hypothetical protein